MSAVKPILEVKNLSVNYGAIQALREVSFFVNPGEIVTLIGANGAGKSTTLRALSRIIRVRSGSISYDGHDLLAMRPDMVVKAGISHAPEGRRVLARLTVQDNLLLGAYTRRDRAAIAVDLEQQFHSFPRLAERRKQLAGTLSGGEQQMLAIARALMSSPRLLLLDEPSLGLAPIIVREIFEIIRRLNAQGVTILLVEQNAQLALHTAARGYVLEAGAISMTGPSAELASDDRVRHAYLG